jgi:hypothetical protein
MRLPACVGRSAVEKLDHRDWLGRARGKKMVGETGFEPATVFSLFARKRLELLTGDGQRVRMTPRWPTLGASPTAADIDDSGCSQPAPRAPGGNGGSHQEVVEERQRLSALVLSRFQNPVCQQAQLVNHEEAGKGADIGRLG